MGGSHQLSTGISGEHEEHLEEEGAHKKKEKKPVYQMRRVLAAIVHSMHVAGTRDRLPSLPTEIVEYVPSFMVVLVRAR